MKSANVSPEGPGAFGAPEETPFCQIYGRDISESQCLDLQGGHECFGCAATTRLCEQCKTRHVDVPAVGMCGPCVIFELQSDKMRKTPSPDESTAVQCQIVKRKIGVAMCLATQGDEGCKGCPAPSRLCEKCKKRPSRFPRYGLCFTCSLKEYGEGWDPGSAVIPAEGTAPQMFTKIQNGEVALSVKIKRTDPDAGRGRVTKTGTSPEPENKKFSVLVIGADTTQFEVNMLRDPRIRHWDSGDIKTDGSIPSATEKLIYCARAIKKGKVAILKRLVSEARDRGQSLAVWDVPHQGRLREVLRKELAPTPINTLNAKTESIEVPTEIVLSDTATLAATETTDEVKAKPEAPEAVKSQPEVQPTPEKGGESMEGYQSVKDIVKTNLESTGGDVSELLKIVRKQHRSATKQSIYQAKFRIKKEGNGQGPKTDSPPLVFTGSKGGRKAKSSSGISKRLAVAIGKIQEGLAEINSLTKEIGGMDARLQLLTPFEVAMKQISGNKTPDGNT